MKGCRAKRPGCCSLIHFETTPPPARSRGWSGSEASAGALSAAQSAAWAGDSQKFRQELWRRNVENPSAARS